MKIPSYSIEKNVPGQPLVVRDLGPWDRFPTITNAAEELVEELHRLGHLSPERHLLYYDSEGQLDELVLDWNPAGDRVRFKGFAPGPR